MAECKNIMVYVETAEGNPVKVGLEMLSPAKKLADKVTAVVIGGGVADAAKEVAKAGADQVICVDSEDYKEFNLDAYAQVLVELVKVYGLLSTDIVVISSQVGDASNPLLHTSTLPVHPVLSQSGLTIIFVAFASVSIAFFITICSFVIFLENVIVFELLPPRASLAIISTVFVLDPQVSQNVSVIPTV